MSELQALETLFRLQRQYRKTLDGRLVFRAIRLCRQHNFDFPAWVLSFVDTMARDILAAKGNIHKIASAARLGPRDPQTFNDKISHALGFISGDFEAVADSSPDSRLFDRLMELRNQTIRPDTNRP